MRPRIKKQKEEITYEKVNLSRFTVKARSFNKAWNKLQAYQHKEIKEMFSSLTVKNLLADKWEARAVVSERPTEEKVINFISSIVVPTEIAEVVCGGEVRLLPSNFREYPQVQSETVTTIKWYD
jgi:hypothetical protein